MALTYHNNNSISNITSFPQVPSGSPVLLSTATASASASIEFNSTYINSSYQIYKFELINIQPTADNNSFFVNFSIDNGSNYNVAKTSTFFKSQHSEDNVVAELVYDDRYDQAQGTGGQHVFVGEGNDADENSCSEIYLFAPSSTTYVKHFLITSNYFNTNNYSINSFTGGYCNTLSPVNAVKFFKDTANFNGQIKLYGIGAN